MLSVRAVKFSYEPSEETLSLLETYRQMCNDAIHVAIQYEEQHDGQKVTSRFQLIELAYSRLLEYSLHTHYILSACEVAYSAYQNKKRNGDPYVERAFLKLDNQAYKLDYLLLRIPVKPREFIFITIKGSNYHLSYLGDRSLKRGSITITDTTVSISFSKQIAAIEPLGKVGIDVNERNVTVSDTLGITKAYDISEVAETKANYKEIRAKIAQRTQRDRRAQQKILRKIWETGTK